MTDHSDRGDDQPDGSLESNSVRDGHDHLPAEADPERDVTPSVNRSRTAKIQTTHRDAETVAAAVRPDNTDSMRTTVTNGRVTTHIERETTGGLESSVDDYVVNVTVAETVLDAVSATVDAPESTTVADQHQDNT